MEVKSKTAGEKMARKRGMRLFHGIKVFALGSGFIADIVFKNSYGQYESKLIAEEKTYDAALLKAQAYTLICRAQAKEAKQGIKYQEAR